MDAALNGAVERATIIVDAGGDIMLTVRLPSADELKTQVAQYLANSQLLIAASPVFRAMLGGHSHFREATELSTRARSGSTLPVEVTLEDDDPNAIGVVLWAVHHRHSKVPRKLSFQELYKIALVIDKYDIREAMSSWLEGFWLPEWKTSAMSAIFRDNLEWPKWLFMSCVFKERAIFQAVAKRLVLESKRPDPHSRDLIIGEMDDSWCIGVPRPVLGTVSNQVEVVTGRYWMIPANKKLFTPQKDEISRVRSEILHRCRTCVSSCLISYSNFKTKKCRAIGITEDERQLCDSIIYGQFIHGLYQVGLWEQEPGLACYSTWVTASVAEIRSHLAQLAISYIIGDETVPNCYYCGISVEYLCPSCEASTFPAAPRYSHRDFCDVTRKLRSQINEIYDQDLDFECVPNVTAEKPTWDFITYE